MSTYLIPTVEKLEETVEKMIKCNLTGRKTLIPKSGIAYDFERNTYIVYVGKSLNAKNKLTADYETFHTAEEAIDRRIEYINSQNNKQKTNTPKENRKKTLEEFGMFCCETKRNIKESTRILSKDTLKRICRKLGKKRIIDLDSDTLELFLIEEENIFSLSTLHTEYCLLNYIFNRAVKSKIISQNPMDVIEPVKRKTENPSAFSEEEMILLLERCLKYLKDNKFNIEKNAEYCVISAVLICLSTGARISESLGLKFDSFYADDNGCYMLIDYARNKYSALEQTDLKNPQSGRMQLINSFTIAAFYILQERYEYLKDDSSHFQDSNYLICLNNGKPISYYTINSKHNKVMKNIFPELEEKIGGFGIYRHSYATLLNNSGVEPEKLKRLMGHKKYDTTERYYIKSSKRTDTQAAQKYISGLYGDNIPTILKDILDKESSDDDTQNLIA